MSGDLAHPASFRDPSGFVFQREGTVYRQINQSYRPHYEALKASGLYDELAAEGMLLPHDEAPLPCPEPGPGWRVVKPEPVPFVSHPHEWCPGQLREAALLTLRIHRRALGRGMILKDAPASNIQFIGCRPVLMDTLSFELYREGGPWAAYRQFCENFLAPLALACRVDARLLELFTVHPGGIPLDLASALLPAASWLRPSLVVHVHWHAREQARHAGALPARFKTMTFSRRAMLGLLDHLESAVEALEWKPSRGEWGGYRRDAPYSDAAAKSKKDIVAGFLARLGPGAVWDLGANDGFYSRLAVEAGARVVALEKEAREVESIFAGGKSRKDERLLPLVADLTRPSPAIGWGHAERASLAERGPADALLALALVHHLCLGSGIPLERVANYFSSLGQALIVEFVPPEDPQAARMLRRPGGVPLAYSEEEFTAAFDRRFKRAARAPVAGSGRILYLYSSRRS